MGSGGAAGSEDDRVWGGFPGVPGDQFCLAFGGVRRPLPQLTGCSAFIGLVASSGRVHAAT